METTRSTSIPAAMFPPNGPYGVKICRDCIQLRDEVLQGFRGDSGQPTEAESKQFGIKDTVEFLENWPYKAMPPVSGRHANATRRTSTLAQIT